MLPAEREQNIINFLKKHKKATVHELSVAFKVHDATIRRDLKSLEQFNQIKRTHGGVVLRYDEVVDELDFDDRESSYIIEKEAIGKKAAEFVEEGDTIIIDSGSTTLQFAKQLVNKSNLTIITNDIHIASILKSSKNKVIVTGGVLYKDNYMLNGYITNEVLSALNPTKLFLATPAFHFDSGVTHYSEELSPAKKLMVKQSKQVFLLTDSSKLDKISLHKVCSPSDIDILITDNTNTTYDEEKYMHSIERFIKVDVNK
ncbi:DeoR/GlpR family DNA-binding transcription regulator [Mammaliicoccus stepanovicii]|uniref:Transcriptional regulator n=1 Tax=Mammaliicoccus stepanovicii TaxID=643214 RepID=A0A239Z0T2_9STAP|nr:DeoR/GlpR family DNA-binding transcription regulator [Mammaliicoccus stepanovicii]PNZ78108.1 DeoR/GlpR transcriptional regulator [Mammaliicoccus stepanovicii]GGI40359.1 DeoR family transcriptional regulator [Mammaliicoccus stepanovicii]SNV64632.1 transcriptional regulator [Mammaliicoccus stepanovicii]